MKIAAAYIRVSDERQTEYSPASQIKLIEKYANEHGYYLPEEYIFQDDGISAKTSKNRTEFNRMISMAKREDKPFETILVWKFSRFARNQEESIVFKSLLNRNGVNVVSISEPIIEGPFGTLIERIIEWFDAFYLINLSTEVKRGMLEKASRGEPLCPPAYGYDIINGKYVPNENEAPIIKSIFEDYAGGIGMRKIATQLVSAGITTRRGNPPENRFVEYILNNPVYVGKIRWSSEGRAASKRNYNDPNILIVDGSHEPIISQELWNQVQERLKKQKAIYKKGQRKEQDVEWMLKGLVHCSACGATLVMQSLACPSMQCHNYAKGKCHISHSLSISKANLAVVNYLKESVESLNFNVEPSDNAQINNVNYADLIEKENRKLKKFKEAYAAGVDTLEEYAQNKRSCEKRKKMLLTELNKNKLPFNPEKFAQRVSTVIQQITDPTLSEKSKNEALNSIIKRIIYKKDQKQLQIIFLDSENL